MTGDVSQRRRPQFCHISLKSRSVSPQSTSTYQNMFWLFFIFRAGTCNRALKKKKKTHNSSGSKRGRKRDTKYGALVHCFAIIAFCRPHSHLPAKILHNRHELSFSYLLNVRLFHLRLQQLMDSIITAAPTAVRAPDDCSEGDSSTLITSALSLAEKKGSAGAGAGTERRDFQGSSLHEMGSNNPIKQKSLKTASLPVEQ